jgi:oligoribonuclease
MKQTLLWLDLEMTGLSPESDTILQCAALVTDDQLHQVSDGVEYVIQHSQEQLSNMHDFVRAMHSKSGLLERVQKSSDSLAVVENKLISFFNAYCEPQKTLLCGNSIWVDRAFLKKYMPRFEALFYYRMIDVSTIKELAHRWYPHAGDFKKVKNHTALEDLRESVAELVYYKKTIFN